MAVRKPTKEDIENRQAKFDGFIVEAGNTVDVVTMDGLFDTMKKRAGDIYSQGEPKSIDPFAQGYKDMDLIKPPYDLEKLSRLLEIDTYHSRCVEQKAVDTVGLGFSFKADDDQNKDMKQAQVIADFVVNAPDSGKTFNDVIGAVASDYWALLNAAMEIGRNKKGVPSLIAHVPFKTLRFHKDKKRICQTVNQKKVWFKRFGVVENFDSKTGEATSDLSKACSELLIFQKISSIHSYYGVPTSIAAMGAILALASIKEYNLNFFEYGGMPEYGIILKNVKMTPVLKKAIREFFRSELKLKPHRALVLNLSKMEGTEGDAEVKFEPLTKEQKESSFAKFTQTMIEEILVSHNMPPYHLGIAKAGAMGENVAQATLQNYIDSVNEPAQRLFEANLNMLFRELIRAALNKPCTWSLFFQNIDLTDKMSVARAVPRLIERLVLTINEGRRWIGEKPAGKWADHFYINHPSLGFIQVDTPDGAAKSIFTPELLEAMKQIEAKRREQYFDLVQGTKRHH